MKQKVIALLILAVLLLGSGWFLIKGKVKHSAGNVLRITASFYPYYFFASQIGGDKVDVINITPAGGEPHDYEPTTQDIVNMESSKLLILNGSVEPWADKIKATLKNKKTSVLESGTGLFTQRMINDDGLSVTDPHVWLSPKLAKIQANSILDKFIQIDPENKDYYSANAEKLIASLDSLDREYRAGLSDCKSKDIVTSHAAFSYLAADYGLHQISIAGLSPDAEPSLKQLTEVAGFAKANHVRYIFFESLVSPKLSQAIAAEIGAQTLVLNPLEGLTPGELSQGNSYLTVMYDNLRNLKKALDCQ